LTGQVHPVLKAEVKADFPVGPLALLALLLACGHGVAPAAGAGEVEHRIVVCVDRVLAEVQSLVSGQAEVESVVGAEIQARPIPQKVL